jgi:hypothetical protein
LRDLNAELVERFGGWNFYGVGDPIPIWRIKQPMNSRFILMAFDGEQRRLLTRLLNSQLIQVDGAWYYCYNPPRPEDDRILLPLWEMGRYIQRRLRWERELADCILCAEPECPIHRNGPPPVAPGYPITEILTEDQWFAQIFLIMRGYTDDETAISN